jgi:carboxylate-amine ligase
VALLSAGPVDSAFFEHKLLAERMGVPVVTPRDLQVTDDGVFLVGEGGRTRLSRSTGASTSSS